MNNIHSNSTPLVHVEPQFCLNGPLFENKKYCTVSFCNYHDNRKLRSSFRTTDGNYVWTLKDGTKIVEELPTSSTSSTSPETNDVNTNILSSGNLNVVSNPSVVSNPYIVNTNNGVIVDDIPLDDIPSDDDESTLINIIIGDNTTSMINNNLDKNSTNLIGSMVALPNLSSTSIDNKDDTTDNKEALVDNKDDTTDNKETLVDNKDDITDNKELLVENKYVL